MAETASVTLFSDRAYELLLDEINGKDDLEVRLGDTLDVKASILLAAITLLATQTAYFLDKHVAGVAHYLLIFAAIFLGLATICAFIELWPRTYMMPAPETSGIGRVAQLHDFYSQHKDIGQEVMLAEFTKDRMSWAQTRIVRNRRINRVKSNFLEWSFYLTAIAMLLNMSTLFMRLF